MKTYRANISIVVTVGRTVVTFCWKPHINGIEVLLGGWSLAFAVALLVPDKLFRTNPAYIVIAHTATEPMIGGAAAIITILTLLAFLIGNVPLRLFALMSHAGFWIYLSWGFWAGVVVTGISSPWPVGCLTLALTAMAMLWRVAYLNGAALWDRIIALRAHVPPRRSAAP